MSFSGLNESNEKVFNNADSFSQAFDQAWMEVNLQDQENKISLDEKLKAVLELVKDHPFMISSPSQALKVADFRIRLRNLQ